MLYIIIIIIIIIIIMIIITIIIVITIIIIIIIIIIVIIIIVIIIIIITVPSWECYPTKNHCDGYQHFTNNTVPCFLSGLSILYDTTNNLSMNSVRDTVE